jgi:large subunit ribosomal protein L9
VQKVDDAIRPSVVIVPQSSINDQPSKLQGRSMATKMKKLKRARAFPFRPLPTGPHGGVELLLIHSVENLGRQGEVVDVRPGYAYNYLIPQGLATVATDHHKRMVEKHKVKLQQIEMARQAELRKLAAEVAKQSITIEANATEDGHLYGSVGAADIVAALKNNEISLSSDQIRLEGPLKELGLYTVKVRFSSEVEGELKVWVVPSVQAETT